MKRRTFLRSTALAAGSASLLTINKTTASAKQKGDAFNLLYAPHFDMFKNLAGSDLNDQIQFMYDEGFRALEDNGMKGKDVNTQEKIASQMVRLGMKMGVFVAHTIYWNEPSLTTGKQDKLDQFLSEIRESVEVAKRVNAKWMTVVPGFVDLRQEIGYQTANVVKALIMASEILEPHNLVMVLEPLNYMNHPGLFLTKAAQAYEVCRAVNSPSCKILFDIYHQQIQEGNLIPNIDRAWDEIGYFQCGDNPGRKEPTTGEINYKNVFKHIHSKSTDLIMGMEHGNSKQGKEGERAVIDAYRKVDLFA
jgi:hydroxypyruvate isomerase